jgi:hypothetical protein
LAKNVGPVYLLRRRLIVTALMYSAWKILYNINKKCFVKEDVTNKIKDFQRCLLFSVLVFCNLTQEKYLISVEKQLIDSLKSAILQ